MPRFCEICKKPMEVERATQTPETKLCEQHAREIIEFGGEFMRVNQGVNTGKESSLKKNIGAVETKKVRNVVAMENLKRKYEESQHQ